MIKKERPPNWDKLVKAFGVEWGTICVAYDKDIYCGDKANLSTDVIVHESVHLARQEKDPVQWWENYMKNKEFRFKEELIAYHTQYDYLRDNVKDRNRLAMYLWRLAKDLSSAMYGSVISHREAMKLIKME